MNIKECIDIVDNIKPNQYSVKEKVMWLSFVDETIINDVLKTHEGYDGRYDNFEGYKEDKLSVTLIVGSPYDRLYTAYLKMKIDQENGETARYNNSAALYNTYMMEFRRYYNKTHMPIDATRKPNVWQNKKPSVGLTDAEYENIVRDLTYKLTEYFSDTVSHDKMYAVVNEFVQNNIHILKVSPEEIKNALLEYLEKNPIDVDTYDKKYLDNEFKNVNKEVLYNKNRLYFVESEIGAIRNQIDTESHFRGYLFYNSDIKALKATPNDFAYSAQSGTVWVYYDFDNGWQDTGNAVPDQLTPASNSTPLMDDVASVGTENSYARGDHRHPTDLSRASKEDIHTLESDLVEYVDGEVSHLRQIINESNTGSSETILYEGVVDTPVWTKQPTYEGTLDSAFNTDDFYYVTLKDSSGNALTDNQFMLKETREANSTVYSTVFTLGNLDTGSYKLVEDYPIEFAKIGTTVEMRDAGVWKAETSIQDWKLIGNKGSIKITVIGEYVQRRDNSSFSSVFLTSYNVSSYHSAHGTTSQSDSTKQIIPYANISGLKYKTNIFYEESIISRHSDKIFTFSRKGMLRYIPYGSTGYEVKDYDTVGYGDIYNESTKLSSVSIQTLGQSTFGFIRNGTVIRVTEVK